MAGELRDPAAERAVLAGVCHYGGPAHADAADLLAASSFSVDSNQVLWRCLDRLLGEEPDRGVDLPSVLGAARELGLGDFLDDPDERAHLRAVMSMPVNRESVRPMAGVVKKLEVAREGRRLLALADRELLSLTGREPLDQIVAAAERPIVDWTASLSRSPQDGPRPVGEGLRDYVRYLAENPRDVLGLCSGYREYDRRIGGGLQVGVHVVAARPKIGKTGFCTNVCMRVASGAGYDWPECDPSAAAPVLQLDTEMVKEDQWSRQLALVSGVDVNLIKKGRFAEDPRARAAVDAAVDFLEAHPNYHFLNIAGRPFEETLAVMRRWVHREVGLDGDGHAKPCLLAFDYLKLMDASALSGGLAEYQALGFMMTGLHNFAVRYKLPVLAMVQLNRDGVDLDDSRGVSQSDRITWLCTSMSFLKKKTEDELAEGPPEGRRWNRKLSVVDTRHGGDAEPENFINMELDGARATFREGPTRDQLSASGRFATGAGAGAGAGGGDAGVKF